MAKKYYHNYRLFLEFDLFPETTSYCRTTYKVGGKFFGIISSELQNML